MDSVIRPDTHLVLRLPSGVLKVVNILPNTIINIGKFGSFPSNLLLGRPYHLTFEILDREDGQPETRLRIVPPAELHAEALGSEASASEGREEPSESTNDGGVQYDIVGDDGEVLMRSNRLTIDDPTRQQLTMDEIEELKKEGTGSGKEIIMKIMAAHRAINEKTEFSLAKYTLRKSKKYMRRFTVLPLDVALLLQIASLKDANKIMDLRDESLALLCSWANVHAGDGVDGGKWLVVDDTAGLVVAALAERMGILYPEEDEDEDEDPEEDDVKLDETAGNGVPKPDAVDETVDEIMEDAPPENGVSSDSTKSSKADSKRSLVPAMSATSSTLTVIHAASQPNLFMLKHFGFEQHNPSPKHPLYTHLKTLSWLQLLHPEDDITYEEPENFPEDVVRAMKSGKKTNYFRKRRRWERIKNVVDDTREGGFDGLIIATNMDMPPILKHTVPLLKGGAQVVAYSPTVEPLLEVMDLYSRDRRTGYLDLSQTAIAAGQEFTPEEDDFPLNPTLLLAPMLQTARARNWQVLPGRTHPLMTSRGGPDGYVFTATRVLPVDGIVSARGNFAKKRKP